MTRVERLFVYPVKSCRGIEVSSARVTPRGLEHDRRYMLVDSGGRFLTQRRYPRMALIETEMVEGGIGLSAPGREPLRIADGFGDGVHETCQVRIWADTVEATLAPPEANIWFSEFMGFACGLVHLADHQHRAVPNAAAAFDDEVAFADGAPLLLISSASIDGLNARLDHPVGVERFRPNLVVSANAAHAEDDWRSIRIGDAVLDVAWSCSRCVMTTVDPVTGEVDSEGEPIRTLQSYRRRDRSVYFGQNLIPRQLGTIAAGAECAIDEIIPA